MDQIGIGTSPAVPMSSNGALPVPENAVSPPTRTSYATSTDPRGYIPVYEYQIANADNPQRLHTLMIDCETAMVHFTGIWKALGHSKADVVKLIESSPDIAMQVKKVRGGYLKIQGTWIPHDLSVTLARRVAFNIRHDLVPIFGPDFPASCLRPDQPGYGQLLLSQPKRSAYFRRGFRDAREVNAAVHGRDWERFRPYPSARPAPQIAEAITNAICSHPSSRHHAHDTVYRAIRVPTHHVAPLHPSSARYEARKSSHAYPLSTTHPSAACKPNWYGTTADHPSSNAYVYRGRLMTPSMSSGHRAFVPNANDREAILGLMSMSVQTPTPPSTVAPPTQSIARVATDTAFCATSYDTSGATLASSTPRPAVQISTTQLPHIVPNWAPSAERSIVNLIASPGHLSVTRSNESHLRSGSQDPPESPSPKGPAVRCEGEIQGPVAAPKVPAAHNEGVIKTGPAALTPQIGATA